MRYPIFLEKDPSTDYGVTVPDLPGCFSAGSTIDEAVNNTREAIITHIEGLLLDDEIVPASSRIEELKVLHDNPDNLWMLCEIDMNKLSKNIKRINITIPENVLSKIDDYANLAKESRSGFLTHAALEYMSKNTIR